MFGSHFLQFPIPALQLYIEPVEPILTGPVDYQVEGYRLACPLLEQYAHSEPRAYLRYPLLWFMALCTPLLLCTHSTGRQLSSSQHFRSLKRCSRVFGLPSLRSCSRRQTKSGRKKVNFLSLPRSFLAATPSMNVTKKNPTRALTLQPQTTSSLNANRLFLFKARAPILPFLCGSILHTNRPVHAGHVGARNIL